MNVDTLVARVVPAFAPPPDLTVSEWAAENRHLPISSPSKGARWDNRTAPYLAEIMDAMADAEVRRLVIMGASQTGKSEAVHNGVGYFIEHDPSNVLWVMPSFDDAKRRSRGAIADLIRSTPALRAVVRGRRAPRGVHENESTLLEKQYPGGSLILAGSGTPNTFAGISARRVIADEFERFAILDEGDPATLLTNRAAAFYDSLAVFISTPLLVDGPIHSQFMATDQRRLHLACSSCGREDWVTWSDAEHYRVVYEGRDPQTARLECPCGTKHDETARRRMVATSRWVPTAEPAEPGARGYHLPAMVSTLGDVTLSRLVQKWLSARKAGPSALMTFVTTVLAEPWEDRGARSEPQALAARLEDYGKGIDAPAEVICLTAGVDVQIDRFEVTVIGWGLGGESWIVDTRVIPGDPQSGEVQTALMTALDERYAHASGRQFQIIAACVDSGWVPEKVAYRIAERRPRRIFAVKGAKGRQADVSILKMDLRKPPVMLNVDGLKLELSLGLEQAKPGPGYVHLRAAVCNEEWLSQLCAEHRETKRVNGVATLRWVEDRARNEALDCCVYARAALKILVKLSGARSEASMLEAMAETLKLAPKPGAEPAPALQQQERRVVRSAFVRR